MRLRKKLMGTAQGTAMRAKEFSPEESECGSPFSVNWQTKGPRTGLGELMAG